MSDQLEAALRLATQGRRVFPCHTIVDGRCSCGQPDCHSPAKHPRTPNGLHDATTDHGRIAAYWSRWPGSNPALCTGRESRLVVIDVDEPDSLHELEREHGRLPKTTTVKTPRGGEHIYLLHPAREVPNSAGKLAPGIDVRGDGGYVLVPPSIGASGRRYEVDDRAPVAEMPDWMLRMVTRADEDRRTATDAAEWIRMVRDGIPGPIGNRGGRRNADLSRLTGHLLRRYVDVDLVAELVHLVNTHRCTPPLSSGEVDRIVDSIASRELRRRQAAS